MKRRLVSNKFRWLGLTALLVGMAASAGGQTNTYTAVDLGTLPGVSYCVPTSINNSGQVAGYCNITGGVNNKAFLYSGGIMLDVGTLPGGSDTYAYGINNSGQVAGYADCLVSSLASEEHAFLYSRGTMVDLGAFGAYSSQARAINDSGQIAGQFEVPWTAPAGAPHAFLYSGGAVDLGTLPGALTWDPTEYAPLSRAYGVNNRGQVVGFSSSTKIFYHAFLYSGGTMVDLGTFGGDYSQANAINNRGQVVGWADTALGFGGTSYGDHAFLYSGGSMTDLGTLYGDYYSFALGINNNGRVVGYFTMGNNPPSPHAFLYSGGFMTDLNTLVSFPSGVYPSVAWGINDVGQIVAQGSDSHIYLLTPATSSLTVLNPFAVYASSRQAPATLDVPTVLNSPPVTGPSLAADGKSALILAFQSTSPQPVTFTLSPNGAGPATGSLGQFDPDYLVTPSPAGGNVQTYQVTTRTYGPDAAGTYTFLALLWGPDAIPVPGSPLAYLTATATQQGQSQTAQASIAIMPPPLLLVHGIWSSAAQAGFTPRSSGFRDWIAGQYPHNLIYAVDYKDLNTLAFSDSGIQGRLLSAMTDALASAAATGMAARTVDVVAHSMGGLATRYFMSRGPYAASPQLLPNPVHALVTIGTPHDGSPLATTLVNNQNQQNVSGVIDGIVCLARNIHPCTLGAVMASSGNTVGAGVKSLELGSPQLGALLSSNVFDAIAGQAPTNPMSTTEGWLDSLIGGFLPGQSVATILGGQPNDTIVPVSSQAPGSPGQADAATVSGIVHTPVCPLGCSDTGETQSTAVWQQAYYWLTGGTGTAPSASPVQSARRPMPADSAAPAPVLDLTGYAQVPASNVTFLPASGSTLTIGAATSITAASSAKTITEVLLTQPVTDPTDTPLLYSTQSPFTISFTPTRLGSTNFGAVAVFSDNTYAMTTLNYTFQPGGTPYALNLLNAPVASTNVGDTRVVEADALFATGPIDVTQAATYSAQSGSTSVFSVSPGGVITANGNGVDLLNVSYGGVTATAQIPVGPCTYALNPANQIVPYTGGTVTIQVITQSGCAWTATGGAAWLPFAQASGSGSGAITLTASANSSGGTQGAMVFLSGLQAFITQPATACSYVLSQTQISAPAAGLGGSIAATTSCPVTASSDQRWLTATPLGSSVAYTIAPNDGAQRNATLTVGSVAVPVAQAASAAPPVLQISSAHTAAFNQAQNGLTYTVTVSNTGAGPTTSQVTVTETVPTGMTLVSMSGDSTWNCSAPPVCTTSTVLSGGSSYPPITVTVNVSSTAPAQATNQVQVSGGGAANANASDLTTIAPFTCDLNADGVVNVSDVQLIINEALGVIPAVHDLNHDGVVNVADVQKVINAALGLGCPY